MTWTTILLDSPWKGELERAKLLLRGCRPSCETNTKRGKSRLGQKKSYRKNHYKTARLERDYTAFLLALASGVKTGLDPVAAFTNTEGLFEPESEIRTAIAQFRSALEQGASEEDAISEFAQGSDHPDIQLFRTAFLLSRREGSSLAECLHRLIRVTRGRQSFRRKIRSAVAMQKLSALGIGGCAVLITTIQAVGNPQAFANALSHPTGAKLLFCGGGLICFGLSWMFYIARQRYTP